MKRHSWNNTKDKSLDSSSCVCKNCGFVRHYISGRPAYFYKDNYLGDTAPPCSKVHADKLDLNKVKMLDDRTTVSHPELINGDLTKLNGNFYQCDKRIDDFMYKFSVPHFLYGWSIVET